MDFQTLIVGFIILLAAVYVGFLLFKKLKSFGKKSSCGADCGCGSKSENSFYKPKSIKFKERPQ